MSKIVELFGINTKHNTEINWREYIQNQQCPYLYKRCDKNRKSQPDISIGTCVVRYGTNNKNIIICPHRLLDLLRNSVFPDFQGLENDFIQVKNQVNQVS